MTPEPAAFGDFANRFRLRTKRDACGEPIAPGKFGHLYQHAPGVIGLLLEEVRKGPTRARSLLARRRKAVAAGFQLHRAGEAESILLFNLGNPAEEALAIELVGAKRRRIPSRAQLETLHRAREAFRFDTTLAQRLLQDPETLDSGGDRVRLQGAGSSCESGSENTINLIALDIPERCHAGSGKATDSTDANDSQSFRSR